MASLQQFDIQPPNHSNRRDDEAVYGGGLVGPPQTRLPKPIIYIGESPALHMGMVEDLLDYGKVPDNDLLKVEGQTLGIQT